MTPTEQKTEALVLLDQGFAALDKAVELLSALEGPGYCNTYEKIRDAVYDLRRTSGDLRQLPAPTGIWKP